MEYSEVRRRCAPVWCALVAFAVVGGTATGAVYWQGHARPGAGWTVSSSVSAPAGGEASVETVEPVVDRGALLAAAMGSVTVADGAEVSVAVLDADSGESASYGTGVFDTASIVKVDILAALLLRAQDTGRALTAAETSYAVAMIENSDNDSASALWRAIGAADGLDAANERFGLTRTAGGDGALWGLTQTTAADQVALLRQVFVADGSRLNEASRAYVRGLMGRIADGQRWGVSAAADGAGGSAWALKNGWLQRSTTGLWVVNSIGQVTSGGHDYLVAVVSRGSATRAEGIALTEAAARAAVSVFTAGSAAGEGGTAGGAAAEGGTAGGAAAEGGTAGGAAAEGGTAGGAAGDGGGRGQKSS
ncbi:serine hydrolase [Streptomyces lancefieldiae]|uniref:Serine hydrolase n=1 Tax=Streptomyces lancefieldiae TaxID=3075520 RepID=A0ABU3AQ79_9ACTN|nr:serine hydrolase [Streptomyces sp. DSM 40712]MDT0611248.1 serine hydrolase [Streptomyces sp. DSM 40712]